MAVRLTQFSHGAGCGCKLSPAVLADILAGQEVKPTANILVGNSDRDDAAAYLLGENQVLLSTTDFFMPVVDDPFDFGRIAATNAISDIYAMGGRPILALAILGWPIAKLPVELANHVIAGARSIASAVGISIAGGHSIDSQEPIFGLAVNGLVSVKNLKRNASVAEGDILLLTKPLGIGIYTTAIKKSQLQKEHETLAIQEMTTPNQIGAILAEEEGVHAMTDVTGFGLGGHLLEMITPKKFGAKVIFEKLPLLPNLEAYANSGAIPGGTQRNAESFGASITGIDEAYKRAVVCDPQTSGGLLVAVAPDALERVKDIFSRAGMKVHSIGVITKGDKTQITVL